MLKKLKRISKKVLRRSNQNLPTLAASSSTTSTGPPRTTSPSSKVPAKEESEAIRFLRAISSGLLDTVMEAMGDAGVPFVGTGISLLKNILDTVGTVHSNKEMLDSLRGYFEQIKNVLDQAKKSDRDLRDRSFWDESLSRDIATLKTGLDSQFDKWGKRIADRHGIDIQNTIRTFVEASVNEEDLRDLSTNINQALLVFHTSSLVILRLAEERKERDETRRSILKIHELHNANAEFNSAFNKRRGVNECEEGTRVGILQRIKDWVIEFKFDEPEASSSPPPPRIFWLNGIAGIGKSAIAYSISKWAADSGILGGSFFFNSNAEVQDWPLSDPQRLFPVLAYQLCLSVPEYLPALATALDRNPDASTKAPPDQFDLLIRGPLSDSNVDFAEKTFLIVVDAIDECRSEDGIHEILGSLLGLETKCHILVLVTGRPELKVRGFLTRGKNPEKFKTEALQDLPEAVAKQDISTFLRNSFKRDAMPPFCSQSDIIPIDWPADSDFEWLLEDSGILFIYAVTLVRYIFDDKECNPEAQLRKLRNNRLLDRSGSDFDKLDKLYQLVLSGNVLVPKADETRNTLEANILLSDPLPTYYLRRFLNFDKHMFARSLNHLHSVMVIPEIDSMTDFLKPFHKSFTDFIIDPRRCKEERFLVDENNVDTNGRMCVRCLETMMKHLSHDMLAPSASEPSREIIARPLSPDFRIAHTSWVKYLVRARKGDLIVEKLETFATEYLLYWLEATSYLGLVEDAERDMKRVYDWSIGSKCDKRFSNFLYEAYRFIGNNRLLISLDSQQIYRTAMALVSPASALRRAYRQLEPFSSKSVKLVPNLSATCSPLLPVLSLVDSSTPKYPMTVTCMRYSEDGFLLAAGTREGCILVLDAITGRVLHDFDIYAKEDHSLADNTFLQILRKNWAGESTPGDDASVQAPVEPRVQDRPKSVKTMRISPNNAQIAAISDDNTLVISVVNVLQASGNIQTLECQNPVNGFSFGLKPRNSANESGMPLTRLASATHGEITIWEASEAGLYTKLHQIDVFSSSDSTPVPVFCIEFLPDGKHVIVGCGDKTIKIYNVQYGTETEHLHTGVVTMLSVFRDLTVDRIVFVDESNAVHITDSALHPPTKLYDHDCHVDAIELRKDFVASADVNMLHVWNLADNKSESGSRDQTTASPVTDVQCAAITSSPNEDLIQVASVRRSEGQYLRRWEIRLFTPSKQVFSSDRQDVLSSIAFSPDGSQLATGSNNCTVRVWDTSTNKKLHTLRGHSSKAILLAFSSDGSRMGSAGANGEVCIWDARMWALTVVLSPLSLNSIANGPEPDGQVLDAANDNIDKSLVPAFHSTSVESADPAGNQSDAQVSSMAFSANGTRLVTGDEFGMVHIWDVSNGNHLRALSGHSSKPILLAFSPDGSRIASASSSAATGIDVRAWNMGSGDSIIVSSTHDLGSPHSSDSNDDEIAINPDNPDNLDSKDDLYFNDNLSRVHIRSTRGIFSWKIGDSSTDEHAQPNFRDSEEASESLEISKPLLKPRILIRMGFFRFGGRLSTCSSRAMLFIVFNRKDDWEFIALPTQEVGDVGPVAISSCGHYIAVSTPTESEKYLLLDISKSESPSRTPVIVHPGTVNAGTIYAFPDAQTDLLIRGWHRRIGCQWEETIDDLILHRTPTVHQDCKECHIISNDVFDFEGPFEANNVRRAFILESYSGPSKFYEDAPYFT